MKDCVEEGILQSYFDGELSIDMMEQVSSHLTSCMACKRAARELESESLLLSEALAPEFALSVPTERLRARIDAVIAERSLLNPARPNLAVNRTAPLARRWWQSVAELFVLSPQRAFGYAGLALLILFAITFVLVRFRATQIKKDDIVADRQTPVPAATVSPVTLKEQQAERKSAPEGVNRPRFVPASHKPKVARAPVEAEVASHVKLLPGERSYLKEIAALDSSLKSRGNKPMRPGLQSEYERNLAMVDRAIAATRNAAKSNPNDPDAAEFMFAAYQTKVDLLNQVADARLPNRQQ